MMKVRRAFLGMFAVSLCLSAAWAGDKVISVQGSLMDALGAPLLGSHVVTFRLYKNPTDPIANKVWEDSLNVALDSGTFNVPLGENTSLDAIPFNQPYYLGVQVAGDSQEMTPRQPISAAGFALGSVGDFHVGKNLAVDQGVGIGTAPTNGRLQIAGPSDQVVIQETDGPPDANKWVFKADQGEFHILSANDLYTAWGDALGIHRTGSQVTSISLGANTGIGTATPLARLHIAGTQDQLLLEDTDGNVDAKKWLIKGDAGRLSLLLVNDANTAWEDFLNVDRAGLATTVVSFPHGNVGIGTSTPTQTLTVNGTFTYAMTQNNVTTSRAFKTVYQNTTGRIMYVNIVTNALISAGTTSVYCDASPSPGTLVSAAASDAPGHTRNNFFIVIPGYYYWADYDTAAALLSWIEWY